MTACHCCFSFEETHDDCYSFDEAHDHCYFPFEETHDHCHRSCISILLSLDGIITLMFISQWSGFWHDMFSVDSLSICGQMIILIISGNYSSCNVLPELLQHDCTKIAVLGDARISYLMA